ncbi:MAG TPA: response regulator, partial [Campylobacterales bacterium]|nr:response regulator [Campylobacterales bacterium]
MKRTFPSILFVEDEPAVRFELERFLQRYSRNVMVATNGEEGLELFKKNMPDIVISDIKMPKMNGIDMAKEMKKLSAEQTIIFTTAHSDNSYFLEAIEMQVYGYILKPVDLGLL